jgi:hypothetical protein
MIQQKCRIILNVQNVHTCARYATACEDAAEKCLAVTSEEMDRVVAKRVEATMKRRESDTATQYQAQRWGAVQVECSTWTHSLKAPGFNH